MPDELLLLETDAPYLSPVPHRGRPNEPAYVMDTLRFVAELRGTAPGALAAVVDARGQPGVPAPGGLSGGGRRRSGGPPSQALGITPDTRLGQHFLVDRNIVDVALRLADLDADDVAVEVGPGAGVLTSALAARVRAVHAIELDRRLEAPLQHVARRPR